MQYAQIVVNSKTAQREIFTYAIPPQLLPEIKAGILVLVPFGNRKIEGIIVDIKRQKPRQVEIGKIKKITSIIDPNPVIDSTRLELAHWMADYYFSSLGETLFTNLVPVAKRIANTLEISDQLPKPKPPQLSQKPILLYAPFEKRLKAYLKILKKLKKDQQAIILLPDISLAPYFLNFLPKSKTSLIHSGLTLTQRYSEWLKIRQGESQIVIGSMSALFAPAFSLKLIIIDQEENDTYYNDQSPRFHAPEVAEKLSQLIGAKLIFGTFTPSLESYYKAKINQYRLIKAQFPKLKTEIVDLNAQKSIISWELEESISQTLHHKGKVLLFVNRKGAGRIMICRECEHKFLCPNCEAPLTPLENELFCAYCNIHSSTPTKCPNCSGPNLKIYGLTTDRIKHDIEKLFPKARILRIERGIKKEFNLKNHTLHRLISSADIVIGTSYLIKSLVKKVDLVGVLLAEQNLNLGDFRAGEKTYETVSKILHLGRKSIIQTYIPEHPIVRFIAKNDYDGFFNYEMKHRHKLNFPPFYSLLKITIKNKDKLRARRKARQIYKKLKSNLPASLKINPPAPPAIPNKRNLFLFQIVIKFPKYFKIEHYLSDFPASISIERDPAHLF